MLGTSVLAISSGASAQGKGHKEGKVDQKVAKAVYKADKQEDKAIRRTDRVVTHRYSTTYRTLCEDGAWALWNSSCSGHGGRAVHQVTYNPTPRASAVARAHASTNSAVYRSRYSNLNAAGAIARCNDGTYWHANTRYHACINHGGVARWL